MVLIQIPGGKKVLPTISYSITGTSTAGCISASAAVANVSVNPSPILSITGNTVLCTGETGIITVSGANAYAWSNGATSNSITINNTPNSYNYTVTGTGTNACTANATVQVLINACTNVAQIEHYNLYVYPNPALTVLHINANNQLIGKTLKVYDLQSKLIYEFVLADLNTIKITDWPKGIYLLKIAEAGIVNKFIKE